MMSGNEPPETALSVLGALLDGFVRSSVNLQIMAGDAVNEIIPEIQPLQWYPLKMLFDLQDLVIRKYRDPEPILEAIGRSMMDNWFHNGPGKGIIRTGPDFLRFQDGSGGYRSVVRGPDGMTGAFSLLEIDEQAGTALVHSTTPFNRDLERGIIIGGMSATGELDLVDADNSDELDYFRIRFHSKCCDRISGLLAGDSCPTELTLSGAEALDLLCKCKGLMAEHKRERAYWRSFLNNMDAAYAAVREMQVSLRKSLDEKELLIKEIHHRVKNHLNLLQSLLASQMANVDDTLSKGYLTDARHRVKSISMIHQMLQGSGSASRIDASRYIRDLVTLIFGNYAPGASPVRLRMEAEPAMLDVDTLVPVGLIVNELVSNTMKYAFAAEGELFVSLRNTGGSAYELLVRDNGIGLPPEVDFNSTKSLGLLIVRSLVRQIKGDIAISRDGGTEFRISFTA